MRVKLLIGAAFALFVGALGLSISHAATPTNNFSLQVSPSPLVTTVKPGEPKEVELKIRNASTGPEELKIEARSFRFDANNGEVRLDDTTPPDINQWISFSAPTFTVKPGEWYTQKITLSLPEETGFSYSFALLISRKDNPTPTGDDGRLLRGSVAVFTLVNVDRPGATRKFELTSLEPSRQIYEYLPATLDIKLKNTGNTIVQPYGNVYIQRGDNDTEAIATLPVNDSRAYLLPGTERTLQAVWNDGFPLFETKSDTSGTSRTSIKWNVDQASHFRFGRYTAKVVAVYNDGVRDVPVTGEVTFWVIPWKAILLILVIITGIIFLLRFYVMKRTEKAVKKALQAQQKE